MKILMYAGGIGSGKAYIMSKKIQALKELGNRILSISFADPIKKFVLKTIGIDKNGNGKVHNNICFDYFIDEFNKDFKEYVNNYRPLNSNIADLFHQDIELLENNPSKQIMLSAIRHLMQLTGTEIGQSYNKEMWPLILANYIEKLHTNIDYVIIDDWRFLFEFICMNRRFSNIDIIPFYIHASIETRARRRNVTIEEMIIQSKHPSETESAMVIYPYMQIYFPNNIIFNED